MKLIKKHSQHFILDQIKNYPSSTTNPRTSNGTPKLIVYLVIFLAATYIVNPFKLIKTYDARYNILNFPSDQDSTFRNSGEKIHDVTITSLILKPDKTEDIISNLPSGSNQNSILEHSRAKMENVEVAALIFKPRKTEVKRIFSHLNPSSDQDSDIKHAKTELKHIVFGIASTSNLWEHRKNYIKLWWNNKTSQMRGFVWLDKPMKATPFDKDLPPVRISSATSHFSYNNKLGDRSAIRISRIVSETVRMKMDNVRWIVMGDDDTVFVTENLVRVLNKYDHNQFYYIGSSSESHLQNLVFSYGMAYGGGGIAISYPLAVAMEKMQDECIQRYPGLYGSDDRLQACMAELGVPLTKETGFHQYDVYGSLFGLLSAHPVTPLVSLHHLDLVEPIFPATTRIKALERLMLPMKLDSAGLIQQSICYDMSKGWTISISWGYSIQIFRGIMLPRELEKPSRTFLNWYQEADYTGYPFNTRPFGGSPCHNPVKFYLNKVRLNSLNNQTVSEYRQHRVAHSTCKWKMSDPSKVESIIVHKKLDPQLWERSPRRNCGKVVDSKNNRLIVDVGVCKEGETAEL